jgi:hypothetical protein
MTKLWMSHEDENQDNITDVLKVYSNDFGNEPLFGDYRGIELARIYYNPTRSDSVKRAEEIAGHVINQEIKYHKAEFDPASGEKFFNLYSN